jgi:hypothetical protein
LNEDPSSSTDYNFGPNYDVIHKPKGRSKRDKFDIAIKSIKPDGSVHRDAYHRGIAGEEPRHRGTGDLLCDTEPTDTNHSWDEPKLKLRVKIEFPLCDPDSSEDEIEEDGDAIMSDCKESHRPQSRNTRRKIETKIRSEIERRIKRKAKLETVPHFCDEIDWDLSNARTPTPIIYATDIADEFGLSFCTMLDLARSIQNQIDAFLAENFRYHVPISAKDHLLEPRGKHSLQPPKYSYPKVLYGGHCAVDITTRMKPCEIIESGKDRNSSVDRTKQSTKRKITNPKFSAANDKIFSLADYEAATSNFYLETTDLNSIHVHEFLQRAKEENQKICRELADGNIGGVKIVRNKNCHFCHKRRPKLVQFVCGTESHCFCDLHAKVSSSIYIFLLIVI